MAIRHVLRHRRNSVAERDIGQHGRQVFGALDYLRHEPAEACDRLDVAGEGEIVADRGADEGLVGERFRVDGAALARERMVARQRENDGRAIKRKSAQAGGVLLEQARKANIELVRQDPADQVYGRDLMQRDVNAGILLLKIVDEALHQAGIGRGDHVADFEPADFSARGLARGLFRLVGPMQDVARAFEEPAPASVS